MLSLVNNWKDFGGKAKYVEWAKAEGEAVADEDDFYRNAKCRQYYRNHVKVIHSLELISVTFTKSIPRAVSTLCNCSP